MHYQYILFVWSGKLQVGELPRLFKKEAVTWQIHRRKNGRKISLAEQYTYNVLRRTIILLHTLDD